jgi:hypothetical protein
MLKQILLSSLCFMFTSAPAFAEATLTATETRWLAAAGPVLAYSQRLKLPIDIIVQPKSGPGDVPMAMGFDGSRCKLVLSMRGNPDAEMILEKVPEAQRGLLIEAMAAHEVGHCWRYAQGVWHALPAGFVETGEEHADDASLLAEAKAMRESRREEGFADLVALAWISRSHPDSYTAIFDWFNSVRSSGTSVARSSHDTMAWVQLARDPAALAQGATPFENAIPLWREGLLHAD